MSWKKKKKKVYGNIVIYGIVNRLSMFMVISNIDFSYFIPVYTCIYIFGSYIYIGYILINPTL